MSTSLERQAIDILRHRISGEEFDHRMLMDALRGYARPRLKVTSLLKSGDVVRVKKGIYFFGPRHRRRPFSVEILANLIYGPSCLSTDFALSRHGFIPERVERLTSVTPGRARTFSSPVGIFSYHHVPPTIYGLGVQRESLPGGDGFLIATPERALVDKVFLARGLTFQSIKGMKDYLVRDLRLDTDKIRDLNLDDLTELAEKYGSRKVRLVEKAIRSLRKYRHE